MPNFDALIFDCDGVLVNSEEIVQDIELELLAEHGLEYERQEFAHHFLGVSNEYFYRALNEDSMKQLDRPLRSDFGDALHERARAEFEHRLRTFDGTKELVQMWPTALAVASSSSIEGLAYKLGKTQLLDFFGEHVYSAEHVGVGKSDPAIYLHTAVQLGVAPDTCIVVEDSVNGVLSGRAAGMFVIGFTAGAHCQPGHDENLRKAGAQVVVESMSSLQAYLAG